VGGELLVEVAVNSKEENAKDFCLYYVQEFCLRSGDDTQQAKFNPRMNIVLMYCMYRNGNPKKK